MVLRGPAGVGKSTLAAAVRDALGYPTAVIDTDMFNWTIVPGESNKRVVYDNVLLLAESYLRYGYDLVVSGLILSSEERGAIAALRAKAQLLGHGCWDFCCTAPLDVTFRRHLARGRDVPVELIEKWWHEAEADRATITWPVHELDMRLPVERNVRRILDLLEEPAEARTDKEIGR